MRRLASLLFVAVLLLSCKESDKHLTIHPILKASLEETEVSIFDLFEKAVVIPLETTEESFFRYSERVKIYNDTIYIFDSSLNSLYIFDPNGKYVNKIHRIGHGPGEYVMVYDFLINEDRKTIEMLNPIGFIHRYSMDGEFIEKDTLPNPPLSYRYIEQLDENHYVTWSSRYDGIGALSILETTNLQIIDGYFPYSSLWGSFIGGVFYKYKKSVYYYESMTNAVYCITPDSCRIAYEWDLGTEIIDPKRLVVPAEEVNEALRALGEDFKEGKIPFCFNEQFQTDKYYYATLRFGLSWYSKKSLFYDKLTEKSVLFGKTVEGIKIDPVLMTDDYIIGLLQYEYKEALCSIVSSSDVELLNRMEEEDNIWLVKFIFK